MNSITKIMNKLSGNIITLNVDLSNFKSKNINNIYQLSSNGNIDGKKNFNFLSKNINVDGFRKYFKKKSINYFVGDLNEVIKYKKTLLKDILIVSHNEVYLFGITSKKNIQELEKIIKRYTNDYEIKNNEECLIIKINSSKVKNKFFTNKLYYIKDTFSDIKNIVSDLLIK